MPGYSTPPGRPSDDRSGCVGWVALVLIIAAAVLALGWPGGGL